MIIVSHWCPQEERNAKSRYKDIWHLAPAVNAYSTMLEQLIIEEYVLQTLFYFSCHYIKINSLLALCRSLSYVFLCNVSSSICTYMKFPGIEIVYINRVYIDDLV